MIIDARKFTEKAIDRTTGLCDELEKQYRSFKILSTAAADAVDRYNEKEAAGNDEKEQMINEMLTRVQELLENRTDDEAAVLSRINDIFIDILLEITEHAGASEMLDWIREFIKLPHRKTGTPEGLKSANYVRSVFEKIGLENIGMEIVPSIMNEYDDYKLTVDGQDVECYFANGTNREAETGDFRKEVYDAEMIYLGTGSESDFENVDVEGKIVLCDVNFLENSIDDLNHWADGSELYDPEGKTRKKIKKYDIYTPNDWPHNYIRAMKNGAAGFVGILQNFMDCHFYHEDYKDIVLIDEYMSLPAMWVSRQDGEKLKKKLQEKECRADFTAHASYRIGDARIVRGVLKGKSDDIIVIHSHHDAVNKGAVQDASGMSEVFALANLFKALPESLREKTLMFVATDSHYTDYEGHVGFLENRRKNNDNIVMDFSIEHIAKEMDLSENGEIILTGEEETRMLYVDKADGRLELVKHALEKYGLDKTIILPVEAGGSGGDFSSNDVCSDAYDFNATGIPVISILAAPMYLYHNSDDIDKVHVPSLEKVFSFYAYLIMKSI